jgi:hypothetical protein
MRRRKSWQEKLLDNKDLPKVVKIGPKMRKSSIVELRA